MRIGIIGAGHIGGNVARQAVRVGHEVIVSFSRQPGSLQALAGDLGPLAATGTAREAVADADITVLSVPWRAIDLALEAAGPLEGRVVVDTTNHFGAGPGPAPGQTTAGFNAARMAGAHYVKCFNTLTAGFQASTAQRAGDRRVVQWLAGDHREATDLVAKFVESLGYVPVDLGGTEDCAVMEPPRGAGSVYGEEYRAADAQAVVEAVRRNQPIPPTPVYDV